MATLDDNVNSILTAVNTLVANQNSTSNAAILSALTGVQNTANLILAQDLPTPTALAPVVTSISPATGPTGQLVTITGSNFTGATGVLFGLVAGTGMKVVNDTTITVLSPNQPSATVDVQVVDAAGTSIISSADKFLVVGSSSGSGTGVTTTTTAKITNINVADASVSATGTNLFSPGQFTINGVAVTVNPNDSLSVIATNIQAALQAANHVNASAAATDSPGNFTLTVVDPSTNVGAGFAGAAVGGLTIVPPTFS